LEVAEEILRQAEHDGLLQPFVDADGPLGDENWFFIIIKARTIPDGRAFIMTIL
jgi:hypothetical protein